MKDSKYIDHTLLKAFATEDQILKLCEEASLFDFKSVCVNPTWVSTAKKVLHKTGVLVCTVIGFPLGANTIEVKAYETIQAIADGADEIDVVINIGKFKDGDLDYIKNELSRIVRICRGKVVKAIIETCYLDKDEIIKLCKICMKAKVDYIKTSTGFGTGGATPEIISCIASACAGKCKIKASGGIRTAKQAEDLIRAGASRIGTSTEI